MIGPSTAKAAQNAAGGAGPNDVQLRKAAEAFEAVFLRQVIGSMRQAKLGEDLLGSAATEQFRDMADARLADTMAGQGSFGVAELLLKQFGATTGGAARAVPAAHAAPAGSEQKPDENVAK